MNPNKMKRIYLDNAGNFSYKENLNKGPPFPRKGKLKSLYYQGGK